MQSYIKYLEIPKAKDNPWKKDMVHQKYGVTHYYIFGSSDKCVVFIM